MSATEWATPCPRCGSPMGPSYTELGAVLDAGHIVGGRTCRVAVVAHRNFVRVEGEEVIDLQLAGIELLGKPVPRGLAIPFSDKRTELFAPRWAHLLWWALREPVRKPDPADDRNFLRLLPSLSTSEELQEALCACADLTSSLVDPDDTRSAIRKFVKENVT